MEALKKFIIKNMKVLIALGLAATLALSSTIGAALADSSTPSGSGTSADPYIITTASQLANIPTLGMSASYKLGNDIDLSSYGTWTPIGVYSYDSDYNKPFTGSFDGSGHTISGLTVGSAASPANKMYVGVFGYAKNATIKNLTVSGSIFTSSQNAGLLVGDIDGSTVISNCNSSGVVSGYAYVGGLAGSNANSSTAVVLQNDKSSATVTATNNYGGGLIGYDYGTITNCSASGDVKGGQYAGGLVGEDTAITSGCYATGNVTLTADGYCGGFAGTAGAPITNSYSVGNVTGLSLGTGGFVGYVFTGSPITNCFSLGTVSATNKIGGFAGPSSSAIKNCYEAGQVSSTGSSAAAFGLNSSTDCYFDSTVNTTVTTDSSATGKTSTIMKAQAFADTLNSNITSLTLTNTVAWKYSASVNSGYPFLNGVGVGVDTTPPTGTFSLSPSASTPGPVTITLTATDDISGVASITLPDNSTVTTSIATYQVSANGNYNFTVKDNAGNSAALTEAVSNISATSTTSNLSIAATYAFSSDSTSATVTADVTDDSGTTVSVMAYASGTQTAGYFASAGTAITPSAGSGSGVIGIGTFNVSGNGTYTVYVKDSKNNETVQTVTISGIGSGSSSSDPSSSSSGSSSSSSSGSTSQTDTVGVSGTISASGISVTHPTSINYTIDANGNFVSPDFPITNNSAGPVKVTVESLKSIAGGSLQFTDVDPLSENWSNLDLADSLKYIALGIGADTSTGWTSGESTNTFWSVNTTPLAIGDIASAGSASLKLTAYNGKVFDKSYTAEHSLVLEFDLD